MFKKKPFLISLLLITIAGISSIFCSLWFSSFKIQSESNDQVYDIFPINYVPYYISKGDIEKKYVYSVEIGAVDSAEEVKVFTTEKGIFKEGDFFNKDNLYGSFSPDFTGRVVDVASDAEKDTIKALNYENRKFTTYVNSTDLSFFTYGSEMLIDVGNFSCTAFVNFIDLLHEQSNNDGIKVELIINATSIRSDNIYLIIGTSAELCFNKQFVSDGLRCFKSAFESSYLKQGDIIFLIIKKKDGNYKQVRATIGLVGDAFVQLVSNEIEEGDIICV